MSIEILSKPLSIVDQVSHKCDVRHLCLCVNGRVMSGEFIGGPEDRAEQIRAALALLRTESYIAPEALRDACAVILALSEDPFDRMLAEAIIQNDRNNGGRIYKKFDT